MFAKLSLLTIMYTLFGVVLIFILILLCSSPNCSLIEEEFRIHRNGDGRRPGRGGGRRPGRGRGRWRRPGLFWPWRYPIRYNSPWLYSYPVYNYTYTQPTIPVEKYTVRIGPKTEEHPFKDEGSDVGYMITKGQSISCGTSGARLSLQYGRTYEFDIFTDKDCLTGVDRFQPFFFTTDRHGGSTSGNLFNVKPTINGTLKITITRDLPSQFFYQSAISKDVGGYVFLYD